MAGLEQLKKRLHSVKVSGQLASAMKTVASAKYSRLNSAVEEYKHYSNRLDELRRMCGGALSDVMQKPAADAPVCYILLGCKRGLNGAYNASLHNYAERIIKEADSPYVIVSGKRAATFLREHRITVSEEYTVSDIPTMEELKPLLSRVRLLYTEGKICRVDVIYQRYVNTLVQTPSVKQILPLSTEESATDAKPSDILWLPDREYIARSLINLLIDSAIYKAVLESAIGAQSATLMAMRTASDNAQETIAALETEINKKRQAAVTSAVLETSSEMLGEGV